MTMRSKNLSLLITLIAVLALFMVPVISDSDATSESDVSIITETSSFTVNAGSSSSYDLIITNNLEISDTEGLANQRLITLSYTSDSNLSISFTTEEGKTGSEASIILAGQGHTLVTMTITADRYASADVADATINISITSLDTTDTESSSISKDLSVAIESSLDTGSSFNKILGWFSNPLPSPFNQPAFTALITFVLGIFLGLIALMTATPIVLRLVFGKNESSEKLKFRKSIEKLLFLVVIVYIVGITLVVYGASNHTISDYNTWANVLYTLLGAIILWRMYERFISFTLNRIHKEMTDGDDTDDNGRSDLEPLFRLVGKIVICAVSVAFVLAGFGLDIGAILTSAGLVSLGITYGAQNVLNQFFNGVVLLMTRPFKSGDLIQIGTGTKTYRVKSVTVMNTLFENWANEETIIMPNNVVASSTITNITGKDLTYKINVFMTVAYGEDIDAAKKIMLDIGMNHPDVIIDGTVDLPYVRVTEFQDSASAIQLRLTVFIRDYNDYGKVGSQLSEQIYKEFVDKGISIPYPQLDVHLDYIRDNDDS